MFGGVFFSGRGGIAVSSIRPVVFKWCCVVLCFDVCVRLRIRTDRRPRDHPSYWYKAVGPLGRLPSWAGLNACAKRANRGHLLGVSIASRVGETGSCAHLQ